MTSVTVPQPSGQGESLNRNSMLKRILAVGGVVLLVFFAFVEIVPFVLTVANSFKCLPAVATYPQAFIPVSPFGIDCAPDGRPLPANQTATALTFNPTNQGYAEVFSNNLGRWFINTIIYAVGVTVLRLLFDSLAGYALARIKFPGNRILFFLMLGTLMIPGIVLLIPRFIILQQLGMLNTYQGFILSLAADAFGVFLMKQFFESIPGEIEEAAQVDGASRFTIFFRIILPMATPALTALTIFSFQGTWNNFMDALIIVGGKQELFNLPLGLALLKGSEGQTLRWNTFLAGSVITTLPLAIVFFAFQRYFVEGISYSGLKG